jgi:hypothetical protein
MIILQIDTPDVSLFGKTTASLIFESYDGGRDSKERLTQVETAREADTGRENTKRLYR